MTVNITMDGGLAIVTINNPPVNAAAHAVREGLLNAVSTCDEAGSLSAVVLICEGRTFVAGADIREFSKPPVAPHLPDVLHAIENAKVPWVAAIHGTALGGGLELAMACHARIAAADAKMGLPEVHLGLIPGAGGTIRLPRLAPISDALEIITSGKPIKADRALELGVVDLITREDLLESAKRFALNLPGTVGPTLSKPVKEIPDVDGLDGLKKKIIAKARGQESIAAAVACVEYSIAHSPEEAFQNERDTFLKLKSSRQSEALRHVFFAERATLQDPRCKGETRPFGKIGIIGGGTMGAGIAASCLLSGLNVLMIERDEEAADAGKQRLHAILEQSASRGIISDERKAELHSNFDALTGYDALHDTDLIIEAVFEDMAVKKEVFSELDKAARSDAILATNTSYLDVNEIAECMKDPSRVVGLHFFSPAHIMKLLEIVLPQNVADDVVATAAAFSKTLRKMPVLSGVCDGFIANRIMSSYRKEADFLIEDGALPWEVDKAMRDFGYGMGIFEMQDLAGLDIGWANRKRLAPFRDPSERYVAIADRLCELGRFGRKTGSGWYNYETGKAVPDPDVEEIIAKEREKKQIEKQFLSADDIMNRILNAMQLEAQKVLNEGIAYQASDIDVAIINGYGFPRYKGGPMFMLQGQN